MRNEWTIYDKRTEEQLTGCHESVGVFYFERTENPLRLYLTDDELVALMTRIEGATRRKVGCQYVG